MAAFLKNVKCDIYIEIWWLKDLNVTARVFSDYNWAIIFIFAVLGLWPHSRSYT